MKIFRVLSRAGRVLLMLACLMGWSLPALAQATQHAEQVEDSFAQDFPKTSFGGSELEDVNWSAEVQKDLRLAEYRVTWQDQTYLADLPAAYQAPNRAQNLRAYFTPDGLRLIPRQFDGETPPWEWGLALTAYGFTGKQKAAGAASLRAQDNRLEYPRGELVDWFVNLEKGLEHGFTLTPTISPSGGGMGSQECDFSLDFALSGSLTPHMEENGQKVEFSTPGGVIVLIYSELHAWDAAGTELPARLELLAQDGLRIRIDVGGAIYPITIDPLITTPSWMAESNQEEAEFGYSVSTAGDVNGDGYSDVIIGAPYFDNGETDEGSAFVYYGSASGLSAGSAWTAESDQASAEFGISVGTAGDVNGDGYSDVIVGAPYFDDDQTDQGKVYVFHGSSGGLSAEPDWIAEGDQTNAYFGISVGSAGDVNGDVYSDVIIGASGYENGQASEGRVYVYQGSDTGLNASPSWMAESDQEAAHFGSAVGTTGDVNGDGYADVIVGAPDFDNGETDEGCAFVFLGSSGGVSASFSWTGESDQENAHFGVSAGTAGDVNGDGYADVIVGADGYDNPQTDEGRAYVYYGSSGGLNASYSWAAESDQANAHFGVSAGTGGDVNGDGYADVIVGAPYYDFSHDDEGRSYVYFGSASGLAGSPSWTAESNQQNAHFGNSVGTAGDVNGDGYADVIIGAHRYHDAQIGEGRAYVFQGASAGLSAGFSWTAESDQADAFLGISVSTAGDVNGDGYADVIVGANGYDNGQTNEGRAYAYYGSANGLSLSPSWTAESNRVSAHFGISVAGAGDVNGDGYEDVIVGAANYTNGQSDEGRAFVFQGSPSGLSASPSWSAESDQESAEFGTSVGTAGDVNADGYSDVIIGAPLYDNGQTNEGRAFIYSGGPSGLGDTPAWTVESDQANAWMGFSVGSAGDVNGDGCMDVIVGAPYYDNHQTDEGRAYVYQGCISSPNVSPSWMTESNQVGAYFGVSVGSAGDVNGDGYADVVIGADLYDNGETDEGRAFVFYGGSSGLNANPAWTGESDQVGAEFGYSVGTSGDVNGDGYADVIIGAPFYDNGQTNEGRVYVYTGSASGLSASPSWMAESDQAYAQLGITVSTAGDANGDGYADGLAGANLYDNGEADEGRVYFYCGNQRPGVPLLPSARRSDDSAPIAPGGRSDSILSFRVAALGRIPFGRGKVKLQWEVKPLGSPFNGVPSGQSVAWLDTGVAGVALNELVDSLGTFTTYHWRIRLLYHPAITPWQQSSRWFTQPWNGWNETDLRTNALYFYLPMIKR
jgi:hypothetical protein